MTGGASGCAARQAPDILTSMGDISVERVLDEDGARLEVRDRYGTVVGSVCLTQGTLRPRLKHETGLLVALLAEWFDVEAERLLTSSLDA